ncbi:hypothetical protein sos41_02540 [Alphaproteobacteria bacterium SO-S41]|nr:hypothetical protein sos41_02540 [Alphaproteobacteria bacterium SO-S41]
MTLTIQSEIPAGEMLAEVWVFFGSPALGFIDWVTPFFKNENFAPALAMAMIAAAVLLGLVELGLSLARTGSLRARIKLIERVLRGSGDRDGERRAFSAAFGEISLAMRKHTRFTNTVRAWDEFSECIVDETESPIRNTARPSAFFSKTLQAPKGLTFWSNMFVGIGLLLTFLGIVVALRETGQKLQNTSDVAATQEALSNLIKITAFKFTTSIAGVLGSLILRIFERYIAKRHERCIHHLCDLIERGMLYVSQQSIAVMQLEEVREQSTQLKKFNTDLALSIGESVGQQFQTAVQPIASALVSIQGQIADVQTQSLTALKDGLGATIEGAASGELRALGQTLETLRGDLEGLSGGLQSGGAEAARQIEAAGETFAHAATDIRGAFAELAGHVEGLGSKLAAETEEASRRSAGKLDELLSAFDSAAGRSAAASEDAVRALTEAGAGAASAMQAALGATIARAGDEAEASLRTAAAHFGDTFEEQRKAFSAALGDAAAQLEKLRNGLSEIERALGGHSQSLTVAAEGTRTAATAIGSAASGMVSASQPVLQLVQSLVRAAEAVGKGADSFAQSSAGALRQTEALAQELTRNQTTLSTAWAAHKDRFESVDKDLARAVEQISGAIERNGRDVAGFVGAMDKEMQKVVDRLAEQLVPLSDYAEALEAYVKSEAGRRG